MKTENLDLEKLKQKALQQFKEGKSVFRKGGAFAPLIKSVVEAALEAEMEYHLDIEERSEGNKRKQKPLRAQMVLLLLKPLRTGTVVLSLKSSKNDKLSLQRACRTRLLPSMD